MGGCDRVCRVAVAFVIPAHNELVLFIARCCYKAVRKGGFTGVFAGFRSNVGRSGLPRSDAFENLVSSGLSAVLENKPQCCHRHDHGILAGLRQLASSATERRQARPPERRIAHERCRSDCKPVMNFDQLGDIRLIQVSLQTPGDTRLDKREPQDRTPPPVRAPAQPLKLGIRGKAMSELHH